MSVSKTIRSAEEAAQGGWHEVDRAANPRQFVRCLDNITSLEIARAQKLKSCELLEPRPGARLLDVGCGTGDDARLLAARVAGGGRVVGIDASEAMISEARRRSEDQGLSVEFQVGDACGLEFADGSFDGCRADRVFQHLADPRPALAEMVRVACPGARIVVVDPDWETLILDHDYRAVTRKILNHECDTHRNGWSGRRLYSHFCDAGLTEVGVAADTWFTNNIAIVNATFHYPSMVEEAVAAGVVSTQEAEAWLSHLQERVETERFFGSLTLFTVWGRKAQEVKKRKRSRSAPGRTGSNKKTLKSI
jgi:SAM-dependent methyltransferase